MTNPEHGTHDHHIQAVDISFNIIEVLQEKGSAGVTELARELDHSKSTVHNHLKTLERRNILVRDSDGYRLGLRLLDMANHVRNHVTNYEVVQEEVDALAEETGEISQFGIEEHGSVSYLYKATGEKGVETASRVGTQQPMYSTALGKTILAYLPDERMAEIVQAQEYTPTTARTITNPDELYEDLKVIRERGYGIDNEENINGLRCIAAPVKNDVSILGAISITGPSSRFTLERIHDELSEQVQRAANVIELNTKFS